MLSGEICFIFPFQADRPGWHVLSIIAWQWLVARLLSLAPQPSQTANSVCVKMLFFLGGGTFSCSVFQEQCCTFLVDLKGLKYLQWIYHISFRMLPGCRYFSGGIQSHASQFRLHNYSWCTTSPLPPNVGLLATRKVLGEMSLEVWDITCFDAALSSLPADKSDWTLIKKPKTNVQIRINSQ